MNQTRKNDKNQVSGPILALIDPDLGPRKFFYRFYFK